MPDDEIAVRLDKLIAILQPVHKEDIARARAEIRTDKANAAILDASAEWTAAGKLKSTAMTKSRQSQPTVKRRIAELVDQGFLDKRGSGSSVSYRSTGLI